MTDPTVTDAESNADAAVVEALMQTLLKGLRATQLYLPNNPVYQAAIANVQKAFGAVWEEMDELHVDVVEHDLKWEGKVVLSQPRAESLAWVMFKDGVRTLTIQRDAEGEEIPALLRVLHRARTLPEDAQDDLLTLLWEQDFQRVSYTFLELSEDARPLERASEQEPPAASPQAVMEQEEQRPEPPAPTGLVSLEDFDATLYFLDEKDIAYLTSEIDREYSQDLRGSVLAILFDLFELQTFAAVRAEIIAIIENFIPYLLGAGDFKSVAAVLRDIRLVLERAREVIPEHAQALQELPARLSQPEAVAQLLQSLDEAVVHPTEQDLTALFGELRGEALEVILEWLPRLSNERVRELLGVAVQRIAAAHPDALAKAMESEDEQIALETVRLASKLKLPPVVPQLGAILTRQASEELKVATVEALSRIGSPGAMQQLEKAITDKFRDVRVGAVRTLGTRGHRAAFGKIESVVLGRDIRASDLTEKMVFFEAYGRLAGPDATEKLKPMLSSGGFMKKGESPETRACAAMALGKIGTDEARELLRKASETDKDPLVRNAIGKALQENS